MTGRILPFFVKQSKTKLTDRGSLALIDEFMTGVGFKKRLNEVFPLPGSGRGINFSDYVRTLVYHFSDGGRYLEEIKEIKEDTGFQSLIKIAHMPGSDAVGNWLRRIGKKGGTRYVERANDYLVDRYIQEIKNTDFIFDVDGTLIESKKGDATYSYKGELSYHPMLGFLSDGKDKPVCFYAKFRQGNASAQADILEAIQHTRALLPDGKKIKCFRSDSAAFQAKIIDECNDNDIYYTITADKDVSVMAAIMNIPSKAWKPLHDRLDGFKTGREVAETIHTMNNSNHSFRLIVVRELLEKPDLFGHYKYYAIITNIPEDGLDGMSAEEVVWHHNGRGNCERYIEDTKYGLTLRYIPCGQFEANAMYYGIGILTFNLLKLMQMMVLPKSWLHRTVLSLRRKFLRMVAKVTHTGHRCFLQINKTTEEIRDIIRVRERIWLLRET
ncbi:MAG: IS1380 family transposase [Candidatus Marinimicrobia bacterium]|nr:IS1380 family transposase [Candidatus Neomarinimicrobiota bacterium]MBL7046972.1 IS1380 family transposase [Candidatus Neomarinimicrobiota bacterium]